MTVSTSTLVGPETIDGAKRRRSPWKPISREEASPQVWMKARRSALIVSAWVVGIPCGNPG
jgi:hypothetical protein